jgi:ribonuclease HII
MDNSFDKLFYHHGRHIAGVDETGVSDIAGPLIAACVILPKFEGRAEDVRIFEVDDSKKIPERYRKKKAEVIWQCALGIGIGEVTPMEIDALGQEASVRLAMLRSILACKSPGVNKPILPDFLMLDEAQGVYAPVKIRQANISSGDEKSLCIAAASIIAKVYRDDYMVKLHQSYPHYNWISNKGYPCKDHYDGLDSHGFQVGIHRVKRWPFIKNPRLTEDGPDGAMWNRRRKLWRKITEQKLEAEIGEQLWTSKPQSFPASHKSRRPTQKAL